MKDGYASKGEKEWVSIGRRVERIHKSPLGTQDSEHVYEVLKGKI